MASQSGQRQGTMATLGTGTPRRTPPQSRSSGQSQAARGRGLGFHTQDSWSHLLWKLQGTRPPVYPPGPGAPGGFSTAAHQAAASPSSPATCQLSLGAVPEAETASLRSGEAEMRISTQQGLSGGSSQTVKNLPAMRETWLQFLGQEDPLEKGMATPSSIFAWRIPGIEEPGEIQFEFVKS